MKSGWWDLGQDAIILTLGALASEYCAFFSFSSAFLLVSSVIDDSEVLVVIICTCGLLES
jgi:hypothetical protein